MVSRPKEIDRLNRDAVVIGDPDLRGDKRYKFIPLPGAREEATEVAELWSPSSSTVLLDEDAERDRVTALLSRWDVRNKVGLIYFATHAVSDAANPMDGSFLALKGDYLYGRDIKELALYSHPLIVMSACQTALGKTFDAGTFGLARAWWQAGAGQVVMSLWNIDDAATRDLMVTFMHMVTITESPDRLSNVEKNSISVAREEMLRQAMLDMRMKYEDPAMWASFLLFGIPTKVGARGP